jgi:protein-S-isoprenylcysteine O-methyltransferase Ste14
MIETWANIFFAGICLVALIVNVRWLTNAYRGHIPSEIYIHAGLVVFFTLLVLEFAFGNTGIWKRFDILWLRVIGFILYIPSAILVFSSMVELKRKGKPDTSDPCNTTTFIDTGTYRIIRQPITFGMAIWSIALICTFQSILSMILSVSSIFCFWMSAIKEAEYNIYKFGDDYIKYMKRVPMWNFLKSLIRYVKG